MLGPIGLIRNAGDWLADGAGALAAKSPYPKSWSAEKKACIGGIAGTVLGAGLFLAAAEVAVGSVLLGSFVAWLGFFPGAATQLFGIAAAATVPAIFGAGMVKGADRHCGIQTSVLNAGERMMDRVENFFRRDRAPSVTHKEPVYGPLPKPVSRFKKITQKFAKAVNAAPVAVPAAQPAPQGPRP